MDGDRIQAGFMAVHVVVRKLHIEGQWVMQYQNGHDIEGKVWCPTKLCEDVGISVSMLPVSAFPHIST